MGPSAPAKPGLGESIGMRHFGASAPLKDLQRELGFTAERVVDAAKAQVGQVKT
jgi:transketolase